MIGTTVQNYKIVSLLGEGGMGRVYRATDTLLGRTVAIKSLNAALTMDPSFLERFVNEAKTLARLSHPNIAMLYNYLQNGDDYYMVMEYVEGESLDQLLKKQHTLPYQLVVPVICHALEGIEHAHKKGILHRDIKPANIMLTQDYAVKLMDFGIAKVSDAAKLTQASRVIGTIEFLAPELIEGKDPSVASDIYAIGVTMYELLMGNLPFSGKSDYRLMEDIVKIKPPVMQKINVEIPKKLSDIVFKALEKKSEKRFSGAREFLTALRNAFPELQEIDSKFLKNQAEPPATRVDTVFARKSPPSTPLQENRQATTVLQSVKSLSRSKFAALLTKRPLHIALAVLLSAFVLFGVFYSSVPKAAVEDTGDDATTGDLIADNTDNQPDNIQPIQAVPNTDSLYSVLNKKKEEESIKPLPSAPKKPAGQQNKQSAAASDKKPVQGKPPREVTPRPEPAPAVPKEPVVFTEPLKLRASVFLSLRENLTEKTAKEGEAISFQVMKPVVMRGTTVIPAGAVLHGSIKGIGSKRISIVFNSVSAKGKNMRLERTETGAWLSDVFSRGSFKAGLKGILYP